MADTDSPYTYTDGHGARLVVDDQMEMVYVYSDGVGSTGVDLPSGEDAVALARAVVGTDSGHMVISRDELTAIRRADARSMRDRAARLAAEGRYWGHSYADDINSLPLLDGDSVEAEKPCRSSTVMEAIDIYCEHASGDGHGGLHYADIAGRITTWVDETNDPAPLLCSAPCPRGHDHTCARSPKHCGPHRDVKQKGTESCSWDDAPAWAGPWYDPADGPEPDFRLRLVAEALGEDRVTAAQMLADDPSGTWERVYVIWCLDRGRLDEYRRGDSPVLGRLAQLEKDMGHIAPRLSAVEQALGELQAARTAEAHRLASVTRSIVDRLLTRVDDLELAAREAHQSGGAEHVQVAGGYAEEADEYRTCGATVDWPDGVTFTCARRIGHVGGCGPRRDT